MEYIVTKRFIGKALCGNVDLYVGTKAYEENGIISRDNRALCFATSENAHVYFTRNDDGKATERRNLINAIFARMPELDVEVVDAMEKDAICRKYRRGEHSDYWVWNHAFYNADISDLQHIAAFIGINA